MTTRETSEAVSESSAPSASTGVRRSNPKPRPKPFYKNLTDTLVEVGISKRQLTYWQAKDLFAPELSEPKQVFTAADIAELQFLKRLIVDLGLDVEVVGKLLSEAGNGVDHPAATHRFLDLQTGRLAEFRLVKTEIIGSTAGKALEDWLLDLVFLRFREFQRMFRNRPEVYKAARENLIDLILKQDRYARAEEMPVWAVSGEGEDDYDQIGEEYVFVPRLEDDPDLADGVIKRMAIDARTRARHLTRGMPQPPLRSFT